MSRYFHLNPIPAMSEQLLRWRWLIMALAGLFFLIFEVIEHLPPAMILSDPDFIREVLLFGIVGPLLAGLVLSLVKRTTEERSRAYQRLALQHELNQQLASARSWEELSDLVVRFPRQLLPVMGSSLLVRGREKDQFERAAEWWTPDSRLQLDHPLCEFPGCCLSCLSPDASLSEGLRRCRCPEGVLAPELGSRYCLPLMHCDEPIALLYHYFPPGVQPQATQVDYLNALAPTMAIALDGTRPQRAAALQAEATDRERARIARDLHDTLGQSLGYLHLKLDQLSGDDAFKEIVEIRRELERMRAVADESYQQVRRTISELHHPTPSGLMAALQERGRAIGERGGFEVEFFCEGQERPLAPRVQQHLLYFVEEALNNVEKHADARQVGIYLLWAEDSLSLILSDDGKGFNPNTCATNGHFGLTFMDERAQEIGGEFNIISSPGSGTDIILLTPTATQISGSNGSGR